MSAVEPTNGPVPDPEQSARGWVRDARDRVLEVRQRVVAQADAARTSELLDQEVDRSLLLALDAELADLDRAIVRLDAGTYGRCERCDEAIDRQRLEAVPGARFCAEHELLVEGFGSPIELEPGARLAGFGGSDVQTAADAGGDLDLIESGEVGEAPEPDDPGPEAAALHPRPPEHRFARYAREDARRTERA